MSDRLRRTVPLTDGTPVTPADDRVSWVTEVTPRWPRSHVMEALGISERTLQRYTRELAPRGCLTCEEEPGTGRTLFSDEDLSFLRRYQTQKSSRAREGIATSQRERIAQLAAGVGRREGEAIRRELRALAESGHLPSVVARVRALVERMPSLARARMHLRLVQYYATFHTTDLAQFEQFEAPPVSTVERAFRKGV